MLALSPLAPSAGASRPSAFDALDNTPSQIDAAMLPVGMQLPISAWNNGTGGGQQNFNPELRAIDGFRKAAERNRGLAADTSLMGQARQDAAASVYNAMNCSDLLPGQAAQVKDVLTQLGNQLADSKQPLAITSKFCDQLYALATAPAHSSSYADALEQTMRVAASLQNSQSSGANASVQPPSQSWPSSNLSDAAFDVAVVNGKIADARAQWRAAKAKDVPSGDGATISGVATQHATNEAHAQPGKDNYRNPVNGTDTNGLDPKKPSGNRPAPVFNPKYNLSESWRWSNNCYSYALNRSGIHPGGPLRGVGGTDPGELSGQGISHFNLNCGDTLNAVRRDGGVAPQSDQSCPTGYHKGQLFIRPGAFWQGDYHWYRQDADGTWSHKQGASPAQTLGSSPMPPSGYPTRCEVICLPN